MLPVEQPFKIYTGLDGKALDNGYLYFGQPSKNPETAPIAVFWDAAGTIPAGQPLRTMNGYVLRGGTPANVFIDGSYSELVLDSRRRQVFYAPDSTVFSISQAAKAFVDALSLPGGASRVGTQGPIDGEVARPLNEVLRDVVHVNRFGGNLKLALQKVPEYTTIVLDAKTYDITGLYTNNFNLGAGPFVGNTKRGLRLQGAGMPRVATDGQSLVGGTVIQGTLFNLADGFEAYNLGVDVGKTVCDTKYSGALAEGFVAGLNPDYPTPRTTIKGFKCDNIIALGCDPTTDVATWKHTVLCENMELPVIGSITAVGGYHTYVDKCIGMQASSVRAFGGAGEAVFFGTNVGNPCRLNQYGQIRIDSWTLNSVEKKAGGVVFNSNQAAAPYLTKVKIGSLMIRNLRAGVDAITDGGDSIIADCSIEHLDVDMSGAGAAFRMGYGTTQVQRFVVGSHNIVTAGRAFELGSKCDSVHIGSGVQTFTADALNPLMAFDAVRFSHGRIQMVILAAQSAPFLIARTQGDVLMDLITVTGSAVIPPARYLSSVQGTLTLNSATFVDASLTGTAPDAARYSPHQMRLVGLVKSIVNASDVIVGNVSPPPRFNERRIISSETSAGVFAARTLEITSTGLILVRGAIVSGEVLSLGGVVYSLIG